MRWNAAILLGLSLLAGSVLISFFPTGVWTGLGILLAVVIGTGFRLRPATTTSF